MESLDARTGNVQEGRATKQLLHLLVEPLPVEVFVGVFGSRGWRWWCMGV